MFVLQKLVKGCYALSRGPGPVHFCFSSAFLQSKSLGPWEGPLVKDPAGLEGVQRD